MHFLVGVILKHLCVTQWYFYYQRKWGPRTDIYKFVRNFVLMRFVVVPASRCLYYAAVLQAVVGSTCLCYSSSATVLVAMLLHSGSLYLKIKKFTTTTCDFKIWNQHIHSMFISI